jgi:hypothetical protein
MAFELMGSPLPPVTQPPSTAPVEVKALATEEEGAYEGLRAFAAWCVACLLHCGCGLWQVHTCWCSSQV